MNPILYPFDPEAGTQSTDPDAPLPALDFSSLEEPLRRIKAAGFDGVELLVTASLLKRPAAELAAVLERCGLSAPAIAARWSFPHTAFDWRATDAGFHYVDHFAPGLGAKLLTLRLSRPAKLAEDELKKSLTGALIQAANHCDPVGITAAVEFFDGGPLGSYSEAMDWLYFHAPQAGLAVDASSLEAGSEDTYRAITELGAAVKLVYLNLPNSFDYHRLFSALKTMNSPAPIVLRGAGNDIDLSDAVSSLRQMFAEAPVQAVAVTES